MIHLQFFAQTEFKHPGLHVWHKEQPLAHLKASAPGPREGWWRFDVELPQPQTIGFKLFAWNEPGTLAEQWEARERSFVLGPGDELPERLWFVEDTDRVMLKDPFLQSERQVRVHMITARKYRNAELYLWTPVHPGRRYPSKGSDEYGPYFDLDLDSETGHVFNFKFVSPDRWEGDFANRTWSSADGPEVWTHSEGAAVLSAVPPRKQLRVHLRHGWQDSRPWMHIWQEGSDYSDDVEGKPGPASGWTTFEKGGLYVGLPYGFLFTRGDPRQGGLTSKDWEHPGARRYHALQDDEEHYTLEGDSYLFAAMPCRDRQVAVEIAGQDPGSDLPQIDTVEVRVNKARVPLPPMFEKRPDGRWVFHTYPRVITSFRLGGAGHFEDLYHRIQLPLEPSPAQPEKKVYALLNREPLLGQPPPTDLFQDPPFAITRQGVEEQDGQLRFVFHAPWCSRVRLWGEWMPEGSLLLDLQSTRDGTFWWLQIPIDQVQAGLAASFNNDYHGARYRFLLNDITGDKAHDALNGYRQVQDPAADWVETSEPYGHSRLVNHRRYVWKSTDWRTPGWEYLQIYQLHARRFTRRHQAGGTPLPMLLQVAREIEADHGYLRQLGITAILLLPINEFEGDLSWGYNPSYFYAVEASYGGPDALKYLVDVCHQHGIAVLLDAVFNHAGTGHNILWETERATFLDGDTRWGRLINFDHPQCRDFFEKNLLFWNRQYRIDGFRFDHTKTIIEGHNPSYYFINQPGSGGGWEFLMGLRQAVKGQDRLCLLMAEQLPNDWYLTSAHGSMDTQWGDDFHDRLVGVCKGQADKLGGFAEALKYSHTVCEQWYNVTHYSESHDEVGNVNDRIANVAGWGRGLRMNKVAAAATLLSRGIPLFFMGQESGETGQFFFDSDAPLDLDQYESEPERIRVREWWKALISLRRHNPKIQGPAPLEVHSVDHLLVVFSRGEAKDFFIVLNFGPSATSRNLGQMQLPGGLYKERLNSTWPIFQVEWEDEHTNGGWEARLHQGHSLNIPDYGAVILERI